MEVCGSCMCMPLTSSTGGMRTLYSRESSVSSAERDVRQEVGDFRREVAQMRQREVAREELLEGAQERLKQMQAELTAVKAAARANISELERLRNVAGPMQEVCFVPDASISFSALSEVDIGADDGPLASTRFSEVSCCAGQQWSTVCGITEGGIDNCSGADCRTGGGAAKQFPRPAI